MSARRLPEESPADAKLREALEPAGPSRAEKLMLVAVEILFEIRDALRARAREDVYADDDKLLTVEEAARLVRRSKADMWSLMAPGPHQLKFVQREAGAKRFVRAGEIRRWIREHEIGVAS